MKKDIHILFLADTHLGMDMPTKPRIVHRRRGHDFFENYTRALQSAIRGDVDAVVHGGDVFYRSRVPSQLVYSSFEPMLAVADAGIPVFVVPGNHERARIPYPLLLLHPNLHIFSKPMTYRIKVGDVYLSLSGFPYEYNSIRMAFPNMIKQTEWSRYDADIRVLCMHHVVEGACVGVKNYVFRSGDDVIQGQDIPSHFAAILSGHIHRHQILTKDLQGKALGAPVIYPGAIERTAFDERLEKKGYLILTLSPDGRPGGTLTTRSFIELKTRPMVVIDLIPSSRTPDEVIRQLTEKLSTLDPESVVRINVMGTIHDEVLHVLATQNIRDIAPATMNINVHFVKR